MINPAVLAATMIDERAPDIVEALSDMPPELAVAVLLHLPPDRALEVLDQWRLSVFGRLLTCRDGNARTTVMQRTYRGRTLVSISDSSSR
jgi:hypothetical protein